MQKKIIALAIASALTAPAVAMADSGNVSLYGQVNVSVDVANDGAATASASTTGLVNNASRVGVKGSEDLGGGLTASFQAEGALSTAGGALSFDRNTYLGLSSADMGTVLVGRHDTPYKIATRSLDLFIDTAADTTSADNNLRLNNVLAYISPAFSGVTVAAAHVFSSDASTAATKGSAFSLAGMYTQGGIYAALATQTAKGGTAGSIGGVTLATGTELSGTKLAGGYTMDALNVNATVEKTSVKSAGTDATASNYALGGKYSVSATDAVKLGYAKTGKTSTSATDNSSSRVSLGYDHDMSKRTSVYALYTKSTTADSATADPSVVSVGMKHAF